jgi:uncharacterized membrane protein YdjX (TVP38/TMEM64 family)
MALLTTILVPFALLDREVTAASLGWIAAETRPAWIFAAVVTLLTADIVLPVPSSLVSTAAGASLGFGLACVASCVGLTLSAQLGYLLGRTLGLPIVTRIVRGDAMALASARLKGRAAGALVIFRTVPVLAEASVLMAGVLRVNPAEFFLSTFLANAGISIAYSAVGALALELNSFPVALAGAIALPLLGLGAVHVFLLQSWAVRPRRPTR